MINSIKKYSKTFLFKVLVGIIILPFLFWGMGDVFSGGSQNVVAKIDSEKVSTRDFVNYLNVLNLNEQERKDLPKTDLINRILSDYIGKKVLIQELENLNVILEDRSLKEIIINDKTFFKDNKFSRTEYEKFLIKSRITAPQFEANIVEQEKRKQFLSSLAGGIVIPEILAEKEFRKENQTKTIKYIDLEKYHTKKKPSQESIRELYQRNKNVFITELKSIRYAEIKPELISGNSEYNENFFKQLDIIENNVLDGQSFEETAKNNNLNIIFIKRINAKKEDENKTKITSLSDKLFNKIYNLNDVLSSRVINIENKYYLVEIYKVEKKNKPFNDPDVQRSLNAQIGFKNKIENNNSIIKDIGMGAFDKDKFKKFASDNELEIKNYKINSLKQNEIFSEGIIKRIFLTKDGEIDLITNNTLTKSFLVLAIKTDYRDIKKGTNEYEQYEAKARLNLINMIYQTHDNNLNEKYKVELNKRTIDRVKNSF